MKLDDKTLQRMALAHPTDAETLAVAQAAQELIAARRVVDAARSLLTGGTSKPLEDALAAYDETTR